MGIEDLQDVQVDILLACPRPEAVDLERVKATVPIGQKNVEAVNGGLSARGLCVPKFAPDCEQIVVANAAVTVFIRTS